MIHKGIRKKRINASYLNYCKRTRNQKSQPQAKKDEIVMSESILIFVVGLLHYFMVPHVADRGKRSSNKDELP